jgi:hypothetical protein
MSRNPVEGNLEFFFVVTVYAIGKWSTTELYPYPLIFEKGSLLIAQADPGLSILLHLLLKCWDYRHAQPRWSFFPFFF